MDGTKATTRSILIGGRRDSQKILRRSALSQVPRPSLAHAELLAERQPQPQLRPAPHLHVVFIVPAALSGLLKMPIGNSSGYFGAGGSTGVRPAGMIFRTASTISRRGGPVLCTCKISDRILRPISEIDGTKGKYTKIRHQWFVRSVRRNSNLSRKFI